MRKPGPSTPSKNGELCRIDYHQARPAVAALAKSETIYKTQRFSDHAPITVDYDFTL